MLCKCVIISFGDMQFFEGEQVEVLNVKVVNCEIEKFGKILVQYEIQLFGIIKVLLFIELFILVVLF